MDLTYGEIESRRQIVIAFKFFKKYVPGFEKAYITRVCPEIRIREGRRIMGDYVLTKEDVRECKKFKDVIGKSTFKAGGHHAATITTLDFGASRLWPKNGGSYDIPYRCLVPREVENLMVAGKMVSTDRDAYLRYLQQTMVTGQAAGVAAALCVKESRRESSKRMFLSCRYPRQTGASYTEHVSVARPRFLSSVCHSGLDQACPVLDTGESRVSLGI
jgi:hypothetical protein